MRSEPSMPRACPSVRMRPTAGSASSVATRSTNASSASSRVWTTLVRREQHRHGDARFGSGPQQSSRASPDCFRLVAVCVCLCCRGVSVSSEEVRQILPQALCRVSHDQELKRMQSCAAGDRHFSESALTLRSPFRRLLLRGAAAAGITSFAAKRPSPASAFCVLATVARRARRRCRAAST